MRQGRTTTKQRKEWTVIVDRAGEDGHAAAQAAGAGDGHVGHAECAADSRAPRRSRASSTTPASTRGGEPYAGKNCVVLGSNNSAHDICADLWEHGADVTMMQRSSTRSRQVRDADGTGARAALLGGGAGEAASPPRSPTSPSRRSLSPDRGQRPIPLYQEIRERDADLYERLDKAGFLLRLRRGRLRAVHEVPAPRLGLLHRCRRLGTDCRRPHQAAKRRQHRADHRDVRRA